VGEKGQQQVRRGQPKRGRVGEGRPIRLQKGKGRGRPEAICMRLLATYKRKNSSFSQQALGTE
jgi:hypothetical protein